MARLAKSASLLITSSGFLTHSVLTYHLLSAWRTLRALEAESELDAYKLDGLKVLWALLILYMQAAAFVSLVGFLGVLRNKAPHVRLYRDCSAADLLFTAFLTLLAVYLTFSPIALPASLDALLALLPNPFSSASSSSSSGSSGSSSTYARRSDGAGAASTNPLRLACDQPELAGLVALAAPGEACERWLERAAISVSAGMVVLTVVRLHFLLAVSTHYAHMLRSSPSSPQGSDCSPSAHRNDSSAPDAELALSPSTPTRIRILPLPAHLSPNDVVYTPVHVGALAASVHREKEGSTEGASLVSLATEVWVSATRPTGTSSRRVRESRERREGRADAGLLDADVAGAKWL
ncbi:hypothetical protein C8J57DRAFT_1725117 [Mycena rebaudengoi]|nr:hypothetical protein C8J57DRAFT_1725117 [Mycena rebaudengoi]